MTRDELLLLSDEKLLALCRCDTFRGSGPGGQHRNKADTAVRLTLVDHRISASNCDSRSQHRNRQAALSQLRHAIAYEMRDDRVATWNDGWKIGKKNALYPVFVAHIIDALTENGFAVGDAARALGCSTGKLSKLLAADPHLWAYVNNQRSQRGLKPLVKR